MEYFGFFGFIAFILVLQYSEHPKKIDLLSKKLKKLERNMKGETEMSKIITGLTGHKCRISTEHTSIISTSNNGLECTVLESDEEWVTVSFVNKKNVSKTRIIRIDSIDSIELIDESQDTIS